MNLAGSSNPLRDPRFRRLWVGHLVSLVGDQLFPVALVALAIAQGGEAALSISVAFAARFAALALFIIVGGVFADRIDRIRAMIMIDVCRGLAVLALVMAGEGVPLAGLAVLTFVLGAGEAMFTPLYQSVVPELVSDGKLQRANSLSNLAKNMAMVAGPAVAGLIVAGVGARSALLLDVASFAVSAVALAGVRRRYRSPQPPQEREKFGLAAWSGVRVVLRIRWLAALEGMAVVHTLLAVGPWFVLLPVIVVEREGSVRSYGLLLTAFGIGGVLGALAGGRVHSRLRGVVALAGIGSFGFCCLVLAWQVPIAVIAAVFVVGGFGTQLFDVVKTTAIQQSVERQFLGRVFALDFFASFVLMPVGQVAGGLLVARFGAESIMKESGVVVLATTLVPLLAPGGAALDARLMRPRAGAAGD